MSGTSLATPLQAGDRPFISAVDAARIVEAPRAAMWTLHLMLAAVLCALAWAFIAKVDMVARADARVIPEGKVQQIASLEGGLLRELKVREGEAVEAGQALALLDPTRIEAQQNEGQARLLALAATVARLEAESSGKPLTFGPELNQAPGIVAGEQASFAARQRALGEAQETTRRSIGLLQREVDVAQAMAARGLMSEVEVMRLRRQMNDMQLQMHERSNRFRQDAAAELVRARTELTAQREQQVIRRDAMQRSTLTSPVRGLVKNIRMTTVGGVVSAGAPVMEIVPIGDKVLVEARIKPDDIGMVRLGQDVALRMSAYDPTVYGYLKGKVETIAPDAMGDPDKPEREGAFYRVLVRADSDGFRRHGKVLPVLPGMIGTADIRVGRRSVVQFMIRPLSRVNEAFTER